MKRAMGVIELLVSFLLLSIIVAVGMQMTLNQMEQYQLEKASSFEHKKNQAKEKINTIQDIREQRLEFDNDAINNFDE